MNTMELANMLAELEKNNPDGYELVVQTVRRLSEKQLEKENNK